MKTNENILITIIIPMYNSSEYIIKTLNNVKENIFEFVEVILIDDGSIDDSFKEAKNFIINNKLNFLLYHKSNGGSGSARNYGIKNATGKYVWFLDADDQIMSGSINKLVKYINFDYDLIMFDYVKKTNHISKPSNNCFNQSSVFTGDSIVKLVETMSKTNFLNSACTKLFKLDILRSNNHYFNETIRHGEDRLFVLEYLGLINKAIFLNEVLYKYIFNKNSVTNSFDLKVFDNMNINYINTKKIYENWNIYDNDRATHLFQRHFIAIIVNMRYLLSNNNLNYLDFKNVVNSTLSQLYLDFKLYNVDKKYAFFLFLFKRKCYILLYFILRIHLYKG